MPRNYKKHAQPFLRQLARSLDACRVDIGWSKTELARRTGLSRATVARTLSPDLGRVRMSTLGKIASALDMEVAARGAGRALTFEWRFGDGRRAGTA